MDDEIKTTINEAIKEHFDNRQLAVPSFDEGEAIDRLACAVMRETSSGKPCDVETPQLDRFVKRIRDICKEVL